ncbi:1-hydroxycarotenoid 3,4-desaturase [Hasllibacter halocynthiae]|uniref:1-hydroxycarotenoid 3,4-desaturase n=1 Tax=Hasllibacter halocynthiae TaxID=595589 RepID=A0A2T0X2U2_9RHOB|nr:1-hydroxycarotenoid 3,4-desaturase CrtD [Hasllibacter halocynthiae]PRY93269.1 1-hydroxycarotenoid 3,4-desaturase [Hasllibacter halocynthiae]
MDVDTLVIGAGFGGLACAALRAAAGDRVVVLDRAAAPGGKARTVPTPAGPAQAGPTVVTMRPVFDALFEAVGEHLEDHVALSREPILARHSWRDGTALDLFPDPAASAAAVDAFAGPREADAFRRFAAEARALFEAFDRPMMRAARPRPARLLAAALSRPRHLGALLPGRTLQGALDARFRDPRLRQLFGRYATYVGGSPRLSPAVLGLIYHSEASGVWRVEGGPSAIAAALAGLVRRRGGTLRFGEGAARLLVRGGRVRGAVTDESRTIRAAHTVFAGDPRALSEGLLGEAARPAVPRRAVEPRSHSAHVWAFAARATGPELAHHNVFFADPEEEHAALGRGETPRDPTHYLCAEWGGTPKPDPPLRRFEIIANAPPLPGGTTEESASCHSTMLRSLRAHGLRLDPEPPPPTTPRDFAAMHPGSAGALYGPSPHGSWAALRRPRARTPMPGLLLAGGGCHPGAGIPMAALSGRHAAEAIGTGRTSPSRSRPGATAGGTWTPSRKTGDGAAR